MQLKLTKVVILSKKNDNQAILVTERLCSIFKSKSLERAIFKSDSNSVEYMENFNKYSFEKPTKKLVDKLKDELVNATNAKGEFLVFFEHNAQNNNFFSVFLVRNTNGFVFQESQSTYRSKPTEYIDLEHVAMGVRVNLTKYLSQANDKYITLVRGNTDISEYFKNWVGIDK